MTQNNKQKCSQKLISPKTNIHGFLESYKLKHMLLFLQYL